MKNILPLLISLLFAPLASSYEVWMGTHLSTSAQANNLGDWALTAAQLDGFNVNRAPHDTDPASNNEYRTIFQQFTNADTVMTEFARSQATRNPAFTDELAFPSIAARFEDIFSIENSFGYELGIIMFYDERGTFQGTENLYEWTDIEIQYLRDWLDENGHADIELMWNVRNNSVRNRTISQMPVVDSVQIEASTTALLTNRNNQITFFEWFWDNPSTSTKPIALQIPRTLDSLSQIKGTRRVAKLLGDSIGYGADGMRSDRLIFLPVTYNDNYATIPETTNNGTAYPNTLAGISLSLLEQRQLFEGRLAAPPTNADADDLTRTAPPSIAAIADQVMALDETLPTITFGINDSDTPLGSLTVTATSSNQVLVPDAALILGGSNGNRTLSLAPSPGQSGASQITLTVNDGKWFDTTTFIVTVGGLILGDSADANVKDDNGVVDRTNARIQVGSGGNSPFVDRSAVFVFELPDLGNVAEPFTDASFRFNLEDKDGNLGSNDLSGLGRRSSPSVLGSDYYGQTPTADSSDATLLQAGIFDNSTPLGEVSTSNAGNAALQAYLNAQYAGGAGIGEYVFLRLNTTIPKAGIQRANLTSAEGGSNSASGDTRPHIIYTVASGAGLAGLTDASVLQDDSASLPFSLINMNASATTFTVTSSNPTLLPPANLSISGSGANRTLNLFPLAGQSGQSLISVEATDGVETVDVSFTFTVLGSLVAAESDADIQATLSSPSFLVSNQGANALTVGTSGGNIGKDRCAVFPFQLPDLGNVPSPFLNASFTANFQSVVNNPLGNVSVYGLGRRTSDTVLASDYWAATPTLDPSDATLLQAILVAEGERDFGPQTTNATGSANLVNYLNEQYASGAGAGQTVFLRLGTDAAQTGGAHRYFFTGTDGALAAGDPNLRPQISFLTTEQFQVPIITLVDLGGPVDSTASSSWSDGLPAHPGAAYLIPATGNLRGEGGTTTFPGFSLTVQPGGTFQVRSLAGQSAVTTVERLYLQGGANFSAGNFPELRAGTGTSDTNVLAGALVNSGSSRMTTFGTSGSNTIARSLRVESVVSGDGQLQLRENSGDKLSTFTFTNESNSFAGAWLVEAGSQAVFENAGAVGTAGFEVKGGACLEIRGDWTSQASLLIANSAGTEIALANQTWTVGSLEIGGATLANDTYSVAQLNALTSETTFTGTGSIIVNGPDNSALEDWRLLYFGSSENTGLAADTADGDGDGESNFFEFATAQAPTAGTLFSPTITVVGSEILFLHPRSKAALADGISFVVEWSDTLQPGSWTSEEVVETLSSENALLENIVGSVPTNAIEKRRFVRLRVSN